MSCSQHCSSKCHHIVAHTNIARGLLPEHDNTSHSLPVIAYYISYYQSTNQIIMYKQPQGRNHNYSLSINAATLIEFYSCFYIYTCTLTVTNVIEMQHFITYMYVQYMYYNYCLAGTNHTHLVSSSIGSNNMQEVSWPWRISSVDKVQSVTVIFIPWDREYITQYIIVYIVHNILHKYSDYCKYMYSTCTVHTSGIRLDLLL